MMASDTTSTPFSGASNDTHGDLDTDDGARLIAPHKSSRRPVLENLPTGRRLTGAQAEARSRNVRVLRYILPGIAVALILAFFIASSGEKQEDARLEDLAIPDVISQEATMTNPKFAGVDDDGKPYEITASTATQASDSDKTVNLNDPTAKMYNGASETLATAKTGIFQSDNKILELTDDVKLERQIRGRTYTLNSPKAIVSIDNETVTSQSGVTGQTDNGKISADTIQVYNGEGRVVFEGNVLMKFEPGGLKEISQDLEEGASPAIAPSKKPKTKDQ